jgi:predicted HTH domain antitoxin
MKFQIKMEFNKDLLPILHKTPTEFASEIRFMAAAKWYELGMVSQERGAEIAGLSRHDFLFALSGINVSPYQYSADEVIKEVDNVYQIKVK